MPLPRATTAILQHDYDGGRYILLAIFFEGLLNYLQLASLCNAEVGHISLQFRDADPVALPNDGDSNRSGVRLKIVELGRKIDKAN